MPKPPRILDRPRRPIPGYEDFYEITRRGHVYSKRHRRIIKNPMNKAYDLDGKEIIQFDIGGQTIQLSLHKTIAAAWIDDNERRQILDDLAEAKRTAGPEDNPLKIVGNKHDLRSDTIFYLHAATTPR